jgi:hypothetical protein
VTDALAVGEIEEGVILGAAALTILLAAMGVGIVFLGAYVMLVLPETAGGVVRLPGGFEFSSPRAGLPLIGLGVAAIIIAATGVLGTSATPAPITTSSSQEPEPFFSDYFSTPSQRRWSVDAASEGTGGETIDETYHIFARREIGSSGVQVSARTVQNAKDLHVTADAHRVGGTAKSGYGYGLFCRSDGSGNLYAFTIWAQHSVIEKRSSFGGSTNLGTDSGVTAGYRENDARELEIVCETIRGGRAVNLEFLVDGKRIIHPPPDENDPYTSGEFGMHAALGHGSGELGDTLEVEFDDFEATDESARSTE